MGVGEAQRPRDPYRDEIARRVAARVPLGVAIFFVCVALSTLFEVLRFPSRQVWMVSTAAGFLALACACWAWAHRRPASTIALVIVFVNVVGVVINAYHVAVGASLAMCVWVVTALLATSAVLFPWGVAGQAMASLGALLSYPLHLEAGTADPLTWGAGGTYLLAVVGLSMFGAALFARHVRDGLRLHAALSEREARLQGYFDLSLVGTAIVTAEGTFGDGNNELCRMVGYARAELLGASWRVLVHPHDRAALAAVLRGALAGTTGPERLDLRCVRKTGAAFDAIVSLRGLPGPQGLVDHAMLLVQDVTEPKRAEAERAQCLASAETARRQAEEANRAKDEFLATVSHELHTPLTPILAWSHLLRKGSLTAEKTATALAAIEECARTQAQLIGDLLDVSRAVAGEWRFEMRPVEMASVVRAALELIRPVADAKGVELGTTWPALVVPVRGDRDRLQQVVANLLANAVEFTPGGGRVDVVLERVGSRAWVTVRDSGEGIAPEFLPHVFERFRQADGSAGRRHGGLGLGLAIVRELVERHGGTVRAESPGKGLGATFTVGLPLLEDAALVRPDMPAGRSSADLAGLHVLVVDDDPGSNAVVSAILGARGVDVRTAGSTPEALEIACRWQPDVVVTDIAMAGEDGYALLRRLRARNDALAAVPAIALTAHAGDGERVRLLAAGFRAYIAKPFDPAELAAAVAAAAGAVG